MQYLVMTETGTKPPTFIHTCFELAQAEAARLHRLHGCKVHVLQIIGTYVTKEVTEVKTVFHLHAPLPCDTLPF